MVERGCRCFEDGVEGLADSLQFLLLPLLLLLYYNFSAISGRWRYGACRVVEDCGEIFVDALNVLADDDINGFRGL